jgi:hypothetical protein
MIILNLNQDKETFIDDADADLAELAWTANKMVKNRGWYVVRGRSGQNIRYPRMVLHRIILGRMLGRELSRNEFVDHINQDTLDNRRENLRLADKAGNSRNRKKFAAYGDRQTSSRFKGVTWNKRSRKWRAHIIVNREYNYLGGFLDELSAARAYNEAAKKNFGAFACLNEIPQEV